MAGQLDSRAGAARPSFAAVAVVRLMRGYQLLVSPFLGRNCRFHPSCSAYGREAVLVHGVFRGLALLAWRLLRCHPWSAGGHEPVPPPKAGSTKRLS